MKRSVLAAAALAGLMVSCTARTDVVYPYEVANRLPSDESDSLKVFLSGGKVLTIPLPLRLGRSIFAPDGKSVYGAHATRTEPHSLRAEPGLAKIEFNPTRASTVPGTPTFAIKSFALSVRQDKLIISGSRPDVNGRSCGVFEILLPVGNVRQVFISDCRYRWAWDDLSMSPDGVQAVATVGSNTDHDLHLELMDLVHGTTKSLGSEFRLGVWSPDGKWIATLGNRSDGIFLIDPHDFSRRRSLGSTSPIRPEWSPDSRYLLLWKYSLFRCGIGIDIEPPATLETLDIGTGRRSTIRSSQCQLQIGSTGWLRGEIAR
ncbi:MAG TPA: hypothetical protein VN924_26325 [Bryobacteraceae bacterium]|nr:hypothetical protein [Bryobacteraceae bacterium]